MTTTTTIMIRFYQVYNVCPWGAFVLGPGGSVLGSYFRGHMSATPKALNTTHESSPVSWTDSDY